MRRKPRARPTRSEAEPAEVGPPTVIGRAPGLRFRPGQDREATGAGKATRGGEPGATPLHVPVQAAQAKLPTLKAIGCPADVVL